MAFSVEELSKHAPLIASAIALCAFLVNVYYNFMASRRARKLENTYSVVKDFVALRKPIEDFLLLDKKAFVDWDDKDRELAFSIALQFHIVGVLCMEGLVVKEVIGKTFYYSIPKCCEILKPYIAELREKRDHRYFTGIIALNRMTLEVRRTFKGYGQWSD
jgi:hypothetical protein